MSNPLQQYFRVPKLYVKLPTLGAYNLPQDIEFAANHEVAVNALSVIDQLLLKTPDALLNGESLYKVIQSCVPSIRNVKNLMQPDLTALLVGIRIASNGPKFELACSCPQCNADHDIVIDLTTYLDTAQETPGEKIIEIDGDLLVYVRPFNCLQRNLQILNEYEQSRTLKILESDTDMSETEKLTKISEHIAQIAERTFNLVAHSVIKVVIKSTNTVVDNTDHIAEYITGINKSQADTILSGIRELNNTGVINTIQLTCSNCSHQWEQLIDFDPTSFFD